MEATSAALQEADNWETLSADVDAAFASTDLPRISTTLLGMKRSLMVCGIREQRVRNKYSFIA